MQYAVMGFAFMYVCCVVFLLGESFYLFSVIEFPSCLVLTCWKQGKTRRLTFLAFIYANHTRVESLKCSSRKVDKQPGSTAFEYYASRESGEDLLFPCGLAFSFLFNITWMDYFSFIPNSLGWVFTWWVILLRGSLPLLSKIRFQNLLRKNR